MININVLPLKKWWQVDHMMPSYKNNYDWFKNFDWRKTKM